MDEPRNRADIIKSMASARGRLLVLIRYLTKALSVSARTYYYYPSYWIQELS